MRAQASKQARECERRTARGWRATGDRGVCAGRPASERCRPEAGGLHWWGGWRGVVATHPWTGALVLWGAGATGQWQAAQGSAGIALAALADCSALYVTYMTAVLLYFHFHFVACLSLSLVAFRLRTAADCVAYIWLIRLNWSTAVCLPYLLSPSTSPRSAQCAVPSTAVGDA